MNDNPIPIRLMQSRSLEHLWNRQRREPELSFHQFTELLATATVEVAFLRRDDDPVTHRAQQRLVIKVNAHTSVELRCRTFIYECSGGGTVELFAIGSIRETSTPLPDESHLIRKRCRVTLLDWHTITDVRDCDNCEKELIDEIARLDVSHPIDASADVRTVRKYLQERQRMGDNDVGKVIHAFNRIVNPEKYQGSRE